MDSESGPECGSADVGMNAAYTADVARDGDVEPTTKIRHGQSCWRGRGQGPTVARMRAVLITRQAPKGPVAPQVQYVEDWADTSDPEPGELRVRAIATSLNHMDLWTGMGIPGVEINYPHIGGVDGCGIVESVGAGVDEAWIGRRVVHNAAVEICGSSHPEAPTQATLAPEYWLIGEHSHGTHREFWCIPAANAFDIGDADPQHAAAIGLTALTAWSMMCRSMIPCCPQRRSRVLCVRLIRRR